MEQHRPQSPSPRSISLIAFLVIVWIALAKVLTNALGTTVMGGVGPVIELIGLGAGLGVLGLIGALGVGARRRPVPVPVRTDEESHPRHRERS